MKEVYIVTDVSSDQYVLGVFSNEDAATGFVVKYERKYPNKAGKLKTYKREVYESSAKAFGI